MEGRTNAGRCSLPGPIIAPNWANSAKASCSWLSKEVMEGSLAGVSERVIFGDNHTSTVLGN